jgi:hypothetical protein
VHKLCRNHYEKVLDWLTRDSLVPLVPPMSQYSCAYAAVGKSLHVSVSKSRDMFAVHTVSQITTVLYTLRYTVQ